MAHMKKEASDKKKRDSAAIQKDWCTYLRLNVGFLFSVLLVTKFPDQVYAIFSAISKLISIIFLVPYGLVEIIFICLGLMYGLLVFEYSFYRLVYLHFALSLGLLGFSVYRLIKEKNWKKFFLIVLLILLAAVLNYYWLMYGETSPFA